MYYLENVCNLFHNIKSKHNFHFTISYLTDVTVAVVAEGPVLDGFFFAFFLCGRFEEFPEIQCNVHLIIYVQSIIVLFTSRDTGPWRTSEMQCAEDTSYQECRKTLSKIRRYVRYVRNKNQTTSCVYFLIDFIHMLIL